MTVVIGVDKAKERKRGPKEVPKSDIGISFSWFDFIMGDIQVPVISRAICFIKGLREKEESVKAMIEKGLVTPSGIFYFNSF